MKPTAWLREYNEETSFFNCSDGKEILVSFDDDEELYRAFFAPPKERVLVVSKQGWDNTEAEAIADLGYTRVREKPQTHVIKGEIVDTYGCPVGGPSFRAVLEFQFDDSRLFEEVRVSESRVALENRMARYFFNYAPSDRQDFVGVRVRILHVQGGVEREIGITPVIIDPSLEERADIVINRKPQ